MRANRKMREFDDEKAEVGIGTMIVFIATVLVAAIAAGVLLDTSGKLQERSSRTGQAATEQVASNLKVDSAWGKRNATSDTGLKYVELYLSLAPGADSVDLANMKIRVEDGSNLKELSYVNEPYTEVNEYNASELRDADASWTTIAPVMTEGDLIKVYIDCAVNSIQFPTREHVTITLIPEVGEEVEVGFTTPASYGTNLRIELR